MKSIVLILALSLLSNFAFGAKKLYFKLPYVVETNDTLESIYKIFVRDDLKITPDHPAYLRTVGANLEIADWKKIKAGTVFDLFIKIKDLDKVKYQAYVNNIKDNPAKVSKGPQGLKANIFYMASYGKFTQEDSSAAKVDFNQNSPVSIGSSLAYYPPDSRWATSGTVYFSYLQSSGNNLDNSDVTVPPEIGATLYREYKFIERNFTGYFGLDYEQFNTFNMEAIQQERKIDVDRNTVVYGTVGVAKGVEIFGSPFFTKLSLSRSLATSGSYEGYKGMWYLNKKISPDIFIHTLIKYHWMSGSSELTTLRLGVGFGYIFF